MRLVLFLLALACWQQRPAPATAETRALEIASRVYGADLRRISIVYQTPDCATDAIRPAYLTAKGNCTVGAVKPYMPVIGVGWVQGKTTYSRSGFCQATQQAAEVAKFGAPLIYCDPALCAARQRTVSECESQLAKAKL